MSILSVKDLSVEFIGNTSSIRVLKNVSLSIDDNEILGVVGDWTKLLCADHLGITP